MVRFPRNGNGGINIILGRAGVRVLFAALPPVRIEMMSKHR